jgi:ABC-type transport system substrate-binding protein
MLTWSQAVTKMLQDVGFNVKLEIMDLTTYHGKWHDVTGWELSALLSTFRMDPIQIAVWSPDATFFARVTKDVDPEWHALLRKLATEVTKEKRKAILDELQCMTYKKAYHIKLADVFPVTFARKELKNVVSSPELFLWNKWLEEK